MRLARFLLSAALVAGALSVAEAVAAATPVAVQQAPVAAPRAPAADEKKGLTTAAEALRDVRSRARVGTVVESGYFPLHVAAYGSGYCLDNFASGGGANNSPVGLWECNGGLTELWYYRYTGGSSLYDVLLVNAASNRCLDYPAAAGNNIGWQFNVYDCKDGAAPGQQFYWETTGAFYLLFHCLATNRSVVMDGFADFWHGNGSPVGLWTWTPPGNEYQYWY